MPREKRHVINEDDEFPSWVGRSKSLPPWFRIQTEGYLNGADAEAKNQISATIPAHLLEIRRNLRRSCVKFSPEFYKIPPNARVLPSSAARAIPETPTLLVARPAFSTSVST